MPAVSLIRLNKQIENLVGLFGQPDEFTYALRAIFEQYSDLTYRAGQSIKPASLLPSYHLPALVMKTLELNSAPLSASQPQNCLEIADRLWVDAYLEPRQFACILLGQTSLEPLQSVLNRLESWATNCNDYSLTAFLLDRGSQRLRHESPNRWLDILRDWTGSRDQTLRRNGLTALHPLIQDRSFENLPAIFNLITPILQQDADNLSAELQKALTAMARRSPVETSYFLRQVTATNDDPALRRLIRRCLPAFPVETQMRLKAAMGNGPVKAAG